MSEYGKLWEQVRVLRETLKRTCPTINADSFVDVKSSVEGVKYLLDTLLEQWDELEQQMKETN